MQNKMFLKSVGEGYNSVNMSQQQQLRNCYVNKITIAELMETQEKTVEQIYGE